MNRSAAGLARGTASNVGLGLSGCRLTSDCSHDDMCVARSARSLIAYMARNPFLIKRLHSASNRSENARTPSIKSAKRSEMPVALLRYCCRPENVSLQGRHLLNLILIFGGGRFQKSILMYVLMGRNLVFKYWQDSESDRKRCYEPSQNIWPRSEQQQAWLSLCWGAQPSRTSNK